MLLDLFEFVGMSRFVSLYASISIYFFVHRVFAIKRNYIRTEKEYFSKICYTTSFSLLKLSKILNTHFFFLQLCVSTALPDGSDYDLNLNLSYPVVPAQSTYKVIPSKVI